MGFWGIEVKPGKPHPYHSENVPGILHITQATLGLGSSTERTILQCTIGHKSPIFLCSLLPDKNESCFLDLQFGDEDDDDVVAFSVIGPQSIHLSGYFIAADDGHQLRDEYDSYGEDVADETESDDSSEFDTEDEYADLYGEDDDEEDDVDSDEDEFAFLPKRSKKCGVVIEEIEDDEKLTNGKSEKKKKQSNDSERQIVLGKATSEPVLESEDEDGFPVAEAQGGDKKRKIKNADDADQLERKKKKKKKNQKEKEKSVVNDKSQTPPVENVADDEKPSSEMVVDANPSTTPSETTSEKKKNKKKNKKKKSQETPVVTTEPQTVSPTVKTEVKKAAAKPSVRTFPNGLVIEDVAMGKPDGKRATRGKQIAVRYTGKLKKNGKQFDSNVGRAPFKFRLGVGSVIKGWDVGVEGMRVGDKRKLIIPPDMGYGAKGAGGAIPGNAWLEFDVELIDVC